MASPNAKNIKKNLYQKHKQPTIDSWLTKLAITHHLKQTTKSWKIHANDQLITQQRETQWGDKWEKHAEIHKNQTQNHNTVKCLHTHVYAKTRTAKNKIHKKTLPWQK